MVFTILVAGDVAPAPWPEVDCARRYDAQDITCFITDNHGNFSNGYALTSGPPDSSNTGVAQTITLQDGFPQEPAGTEFFLQCATGNGADPNPSEAVSVTITANLVARMIYNGTLYSVH